ncbi:hypothetical protein AB0N09_28190 [Streptomyces erythrochromogenes]|uniref:hypothetical protein n=1 Tax=Streptomyces erythrochromogenes TaxID=285574 RepID=UPI00341401E7
MNPDVTAMPPAEPIEADQALAVNVGRRWPTVEDGSAAEEEVVLGAWSPWKGRSTTLRHFDPDRIAVIVACRQGQTMAVYDVLPDHRGARWHWTGDEPRRRVVFHGAPSTRYAAQLNAPAPAWRTGEGTPVKVLALEEVLAGEQAPAGWPPTRHTVVGQAVITLSAAGHLTVSVPPEYSVTVQTRAPHDRSN